MILFEDSITDLKQRSLEKAIDTFGDREVAELWMTTPIAALSNVSPGQHILLSGQNTTVFDILHRIDHGIPE